MGCFASSPTQGGKSASLSTNYLSLRKYESNPSDLSEKINSPMNIKTAHFRSQTNRAPLSKFAEERNEVELVDNEGNYILESLFSEQNSDLIFTFHLKNLTSEQKACFGERNKSILVFDKTRGSIEYFNLCKRQKSRTQNFDLRDFVVSKGGSVIAGYSYHWTYPNRICCFKYSVMYVDGHVIFEHVGDKAEVGQMPRSIFISNDELYAGCVTYHGNILVFDIAHTRVLASDIKVNLLEVSFLNEFLIGADNESIYVFTLPQLADAPQLNLQKHFKIDAIHRKLTSITCSDNTHFYTGNSRGCIQFWGLEKHKYLMYSIESQHQSGIVELLISRDSRYLLSRDNSCVNIWDAIERYCIKTIQMIGGVLKDVSLSKDNKYVLTVDSQRDVKIYNLGYMLKNSPNFPSVHFLSVNVKYVYNLEICIQKMPRCKGSFFHTLACALDYTAYEQGTSEEKLNCIESLQQRIYEEESNDKMSHFIEIDSQEFRRECLKTCSKIFEVEFGLFFRGQKDQDFEFALFSECVYPKTTIYMIQCYEPDIHFDLIVGKLEEEIFTGFLSDDYEAQSEIRLTISTVSDLIQKF